MSMRQGSEQEDAYEELILGRSVTEAQTQCKTKANIRGGGAPERAGGAGGGGGGDEGPSVDESACEPSALNVANIP